ncbi:E3 SUMO-protein ligase ZBED1-like [Apostichopus japonicus]|uniref:E3 SUMO-protein ligase ZBED1-like n=1 Tax=Stichopus japonicus TaxID=307972 RepID=UPI003AB710F3
MEGQFRPSVFEESVTRWGSRYDMIKRLLDHDEAVRRVLAMDPKTSHLLPTWQDMDVLKSICSALEQVSKFTDMISGENHVTISSVIPTLALFDAEIFAAKEGDTQLTKDMKRRMLEDFRSRYEGKDSTTLLKTACFLDPRFKIDYLDDDEVEEAKNCIIAECTGNMVKKVKNPFILSEVPGESSEGECHQGKRKFGDLLQKAKKRGQVGGVGGQSADLNNDEKIKKEIGTYLATESIQWEADPLEWWKGEAVKLPWLALLAKKYLSICGSSSSSERLFSTAGDIVTANRSRLQPEKVRMFTFLAKNL